HAQYALLVGGARAKAHVDRALALDGTIRSRALRDLLDPATRRQVRAYAAGPGQSEIFDAPNVTMLLLKARLFRLTKREEFRLEARAIFAALQALKLTDAPVRYASPSAKTSLGVDTRDLSTLSGQNELALGNLLLFEITGDLRFVDEADRLMDSVAAMRGPWCASQVHDPQACVQDCVAGEACVVGSCTMDRCTTGLLHHIVDGRLASPADRELFCAGCNLQTLYVTGYRRMLAGEAY
ncbi:MAG TPA: hypothetical protein VM580_15520, partial [Labilithrix sp.]|nr:hypothetical protein [Labilithrix sp.]